MQVPNFKKVNTFENRRQGRLRSRNLNDLGLTHTTPGGTVDEVIFKREMFRAKAMISVGDDPDYWVGYQRGLRRNYHGEVFGTYEEHRTWLSLGNSLDRSRQRRGFGYYDGYNFR